MGRIFLLGTTLNFKDTIVLLIFKLKAKIFIGFSLFISFSAFVFRLVSYFSRKLFFPKLFVCFTQRICILLLFSIRLYNLYFFLFFLLLFSFFSFSYSPSFPLPSFSFLISRYSLLYFLVFFFILLHFLPHPLMFLVVFVFFSYFSSYFI